MTECIYAGQETQTGTCMWKQMEKTQGDRTLTDGQPYIQT